MGERVVQELIWYFFPVVMAIIVYIVNKAGKPAEERIWEDGWWAGYDAGKADQDQDE